MSQLFKNALLITWRRNRAYALRLGGDLSAEQMIAQPVAGKMMNHPAWTLAHLSCYNETIAHMLRRTLDVDPMNHPFGMKSAPAADASVYPSRDVAIETYSQSHDLAEQALIDADDALFGEDSPLARWRP